MQLNLAKKLLLLFVLFLPRPSTEVICWMLAIINQSNSLLDAGQSTNQIRWSLLFIVDANTLDALWPFFLFIFILLFKAKFIYTHENMDNQNHCMSIKQAKHIVNAHKHNWLNSFCSNGYVYIKQHEDNNKNLSCSLSSFWLSNRGKVFVCLFFIYFFAL